MSIQEQNQKDLTPFESIGLCFSGGGYRATSFSLGILSYLNRAELNGLPLLMHVKALSSVSGGTLTAVAFASSQEKGQAFEDFYIQFFNFLNNDQLLKQATDNMKDNALWKNNHKRRSFINSFSIAYEQLFFKGSMQKLLNANNGRPLRDVCFNSTEFSFGLAFRFQNSGETGNYRLANNALKDIWGEVKLADAVASSSCFPIGFAPMIMPDDYFTDHKRPEYLAVKEQPYFDEGIGVMDGGIVDNQGIGSMVLIDRRRQSAGLSGLDLFFICDVGSYKMDPWKMNKSGDGDSTPLNEKVLNLLKVLGLRWWYWALFVVGVLLMVLNSMEIFRGQAWPALYIVGGISTGLGLLLTVGGVVLTKIKAWGMATLKSVYHKNVPEVMLENLDGLEKLDLSLIKRMITERLTSGMKMVNDVFLKQIRRLNYDLIYSKNEYKNRIITATVYALNGKQTDQKKADFNSEITPQPSDKLKAIAIIASETPTTLWWDEADRKVDRLESLVACGQFTACYNLMDYILKLKEAGHGSLALDQLYNQLEADWKQFNEAPRFLV